MFSTHAKSQLTNALKNLGERTPSVEIQHYALAGSGLARFVGRVVHTDGSRENPKLIADAIRNKFGGNLVAVAGSLQTVDKGPVTDTITGVLAVRREVIALDADATPEGFKAVACNMFLDDEDNMWTLNKTESGSMMIRSNGIGDDQALIGLLSAHASASRTSRDARELMAVASSIRNRVQGGDFVTYVDDNNELACGFVVASDATNPDTLMVIRPEAKDEEIVNANAVTEIHELPDDTFTELSADEQVDLEVAIARSGGATADTLINYYKKLFGDKPDFFKQLVSNIRSYNFA